MNLKDIESKEDIQLLVDTFYDGVLNDPLMRPVFEESLPHWEHHKSRVINFWDNWIFQTGAYDGGMMWKHMDRHAKHPMTRERFEHWLAHWKFTIDELFHGKNADFAKAKAIEIGNVLFVKLNRPQM